MRKSALQHYSFQPQEKVFLLIVKTFGSKRISANVGEVLKCHAASKKERKGKTDESEREFKHRAVRQL